VDKWLGLRTAHHPALKEMELEVWRFCAAFAKDPGRGWLLVMAGNNGTGKTHALSKMRNWACQTSSLMPLVPNRDGAAMVPMVRSYHWPTFLDDLKSGAWDLVIECEEATLLLLDEVGGGHDPSGLGTDKLCRILSKREKRWTVITTNHVPASWEQVFDRRVASRMFRNSRMVDLTGVPDYSTVRA